MGVKAIGTVTSNAGDGVNISVDWDGDFEPTTLFLYTYRRTIDRLNHLKWPRVVRWIFSGEPQPLEELELLYEQQAISNDETDEELSNDLTGNSNATGNKPLIHTGSGYHEPINRILYGPPGCGKTYHLLNDVLPLYETGNQRRWTLMTFHASVSYEEFVEGLRPEVSSGQISYAIKSGAFKQACEAAASDPDNRHAFVIDEINRANIAKVFGELIMLIETDKRAGAENQAATTLPYSGKRFSVPANLDIFGTMNTADRSIALLDLALRRRFSFREIVPRADLLPNNIEGVDVEKLLKTLNNRIEALLDRDHKIGHSYLMSVNTGDELIARFTHKILPLLNEYFHNDWSQISLVLSNRELGRSEFVELRELNPANLFGNAWDNSRSGDLAPRYTPTKTITLPMLAGLLI